MRCYISLAVVGSVVALTCAPLMAQSFTTLTGNNLVLRSRQNQSNLLDATGYLGTYITVPTGGATIDLRVNTTGTGGHVNLVVADSKFGFNVSGTQDQTAQNITLPGGTYLVRAERDYANGTNQNFSVNSLSLRTVSSTGGAAAFANISPNGGTSAAAQATALAAANTYINNFRKGSLNLSLQGIAAGTSVNLRLKSSDFKFGTAVPTPQTVSNNNTYDGTSPFLAAVPANSARQKYQEKLLQLFNSITPENDGKGSESYNANIAKSDRMAEFAQEHGLRYRQHGLIWSTQQDPALTQMFTDARSSTPATAAAGKAAIQANITNRINTYVGGVNSETGGSTGKAPVVRATQYGDLDVYNESFNTGENAGVATNLNYWKVLGSATDDGSAGAAFTADVYNRVKAAVDAAGANTRLFVNDYNIFNGNGLEYGQGYTAHLEKIRLAGKAAGNPNVVGGIGAQFYGDSNTPPSNGGGVDPFRVAKTLAQLSTEGLPIEITEYGTRVGSDPAGAMSAAMTLAYGSPDVTGFTVWGFYKDRPSGFADAAGSYLYLPPTTTGGELVRTATGAEYERLRALWTTDVTTVVNADGSITLPSGAFYGDYEVTIKGIKYGLQYNKGTNTYLLVVLKGDFNNDETRNGVDNDLLLKATAGNVGSPADIRFDVNGDGKVITAINAAGSDIDYLIRQVEGTQYGDANLDGKVDFNDLVALAQNYNLPAVDAGWSMADFNGDDVVDFKDLVTLAQNYGFGTANLTGATFAADWALAQEIAVPEPTTLLASACVLFAAARRRRA